MPYFLLVVAIMCLAAASALGSWLKLRNFGSLALLDFSLTFLTLLAIGIWLFDAPLREVLPVAGGLAFGLSALLLLVRAVDRRVVEPRMGRGSPAH